METNYPQMTKHIDTSEVTMSTTTTMSTRNQPHVLVLPYPAQGHVMPLMKFSCCLAERGIKITFVNTECTHGSVMTALPATAKANEIGQIHLVTIPDGLTPEERVIPFNAFLTIPKTMPVHLEKFIRNINESSSTSCDDKIVCVIFDTTMGWALEVAKKLGIQGAAFFPAAVAVTVLGLNLPKLIDAGFINENGTTKKNETIYLSPNMPPMNTANLLWHSVGDQNIQQQVFQVMLKENEITEFADWCICNSFYELEPGAIAMVPNILPIGPLLASNQLGNLYPEDSRCLSWLNRQAIGSVIYVAFGSSAIVKQPQLDELALGLELLGRPFLWVVRSGLTGGPSATYPDGFQDRVAQFGKIVTWAPQQKVLAHSSIACFLSHCGWNSTMEGLCMGVPFICWPYFADQFLNKSYITDVWKVGLGLDTDENGVISREEIRRKLNQLLGDKEIRENALKLKEMAINSIANGGSSWKNLEKFVEAMKS